MPSRKSGSSDIATQPEPRRSSLRRLSSLANIPTLFSKKRSNNLTDSTASSSSNLSFSSSTANLSELSANANNSPQLFEDGDTITALAQPPAANPPARRSSYICLPDDPIGGMPRSGTFSNLPLPTRAKKTPPMVPSLLHSRLPSATARPTRLPSPQMSNRQHSHSRIFSREPQPPPMRTRVKRSDTEPLLHLDSHQPSLLPRSTAFKENISLRPTKPLPALDISNYDRHFSSSSSHLGTHEWDEWSHPLLSPEPKSSPSGQRRHYQQKSNATREHKSSPIRPVQQAKPGLPVQRYNSQPMLTSNHSFTRRTYQYAEIKPARLMSARPPPTPPISHPAIQAAEEKTPKKMATTREAAARRSTISESARLFRTSARSTTSTPPPPRRNPLEVHTREHQGYWSGRLCALLDRYRNEELAQQPCGLSGYTPKAQTDKMHTPEASEARVRRAFEYLESLCVTEEARTSLAVFRGTYGQVFGMKDLKGRAGTIVLGQSQANDEGKEVSSSRQAGGGGDGETKSISETRQISFMDRLFGGHRRKRRSLVLV